MSERENEESTSVLIADDHPFIRRGLIEALEEEPRLRVVAEVGDGSAALERIQQLVPDVAILDIDMPELSGLEVARGIGDLGLPTAVILLTLHTGSDLLFAALDLGVRGYILKSSAVAEAVEGVRRVAAGGTFFGSGVRSLLNHRTTHLAPRNAAAAQSNSSVASLTAVESEILKGVTAGLTSRELAASLELSPRTIENYRTAICGKLGLSGPNALLRYGLAQMSK